MSSLMLINPRRRRRTAHKRRTVSRRRNPVAATPHRRRARRHVARRSNPIGIHRVHRRHTRRHTRRRNPIRTGNMGDMVMNGLKGAFGAVSINAVTHFLPAVMQNGNVLYVTRTALALLLGTVGGKVIGTRHARTAAEGALAVNFTDLINSFAAGVIPGSQLHGVGPIYDSAASQNLYPNTALSGDADPYGGGMNMYTGNGMGMYTSGQ